MSRMRMEFILGDFFRNNTLPGNLSPSGDFVMFSMAGRHANGLQTAIIPMDATRAAAFERFAEICRRENFESIELSPGQAPVVFLGSHLDHPPRGPAAVSEYHDFLCRSHGSLIRTGHVTISKHGYSVVAVHPTTGILLNSEWRAVDDMVAHYGLGVDQSPGCQPAA